MSKQSSTLNVVILAAGKGVRMRSELPKVLHRVCGRTLIERTLRASCGLSPRRIIVVVGYGRDLVEAHVAELAASDWAQGVEILCVEQAEQNGTGHAVQIAMPKLESGAEDVVILPADSPLISTEDLVDLIDARDDGAVLSLLTAEPPDPEGLGRIVRNEGGAVERIVEQKDCAPEELEIAEVNTSMYSISKDFLEYAIADLSNENAQGEYYLTDLIQRASSEGKPIAAFCVEDYASVQGANSRAELGLLELIQRLRIVYRLMDQGVSFEDPNTVYIEEGVSIGSDSFVGPNTHLKGSTRIGERVTIEGNSWIIDSTVQADSTVRFSSVLESCSVAENCQIGPFARLRPDADLHTQVRVGNFVEIKKAQISAGAKVNHLTYIGDALVGEKVNVGAGTITCNYDGVNKHKTVLGNGSFVGSNSCFVAPVSVGEGAYIGAGSVITKDVPGKALGLGRARQTVIDGWVDRAAKRKNKD